MVLPSKEPLQSVRLDLPVHMENILYWVLIPSLTAIAGGQQEATIF